MAWAITKKALLSQYIQPRILQSALRVIGFTLVVLWLVVLSVLALMRLTHSSPLDKYADILPGQPTANATSQGFVCRPIPYSGIAEETCTRRQDTGIFSDVGILSSEKTIQHVSFAVREGTLSVGDLIAYYGAPTTKRYGSTTYYLWQESNIMAATYNAHTTDEPFSYFLQLESISIIQPGQCSMVLPNCDAENQTDLARR